jgi:hypothetical protein
MGRHAAQPATFDAVVSDYVTGRARELVIEADAMTTRADPQTVWAWIGAATEILRELTRDA